MENSTTKSSKVEYRAVAEACVDLFVQGRSPSFNLVYEKLDRQGSAAIVQGFIKQWRSEVGQQLVSGREAPHLPVDLAETPEALITVFAQGLKTIWELARTQAAEAYAKDREQLEVFRGEARAEVELATAKVAEIERKVDAKASECALLRQALEGRDQALAATQQQLSEASVLAQTRESQLTALRDDLARQAASFEAERATHQQTLDSLRHAHEAAMTTLRERHEGALAAERMRHERLMAREKEITAGDRAFLMRQTDELRQAARQTETNLREQLADMKNTVEAYRKAASAAESHAAAERGRREAAEVELVRLRALSEARQDEIALLRAKTVSHPDPDGSGHS